MRHSGTRLVGCHHPQRFQLAVQRAAFHPDKRRSTADIAAKAVDLGQQILPRELFEREYLLTQIYRFGGNISRTASFVGLERSALHRKLKSLGVVTTNKAGARVAHLEEDDEDDGM